jgi:hypothetical protein
VVLRSVTVVACPYQRSPERAGLDTFTCIGFVIASLLTGVTEPV